MRLLLISYDFPPAVGGTQTYAYELARRLAGQCEDFAVLAPFAPGSEAVDASLPFEVIRVHSSYDMFPVKISGVLLKTGRKRFPAVFHVQWHTATTSFAALPLGGAKHLFVAAHGRELLLEPPNLPSVLSRLYGWSRGWVLRHAEGVFPVSRYTSQLLQDVGVARERMTVVHNGTDPIQFQPINAKGLRKELGIDHRKVLLTVSRLVPRKGIDTVLRALPEVAREVPDVCYLIGGSGPDRPRLETLVQGLHLEDRVRFLGTIPHDTLPHFYNAGDVFVMPSREDMPNVEGFGIVFLEASASGKPVIGARSGGIPDAVHHGQTGLLVEPDDEAGLAEALVRLLRDGDLAARLGRNGRARVLADATWDHIAKELFDAIRRRTRTA